MPDTTPMRGMCHTRPLACSVLDDAVRLTLSHQPHTERTVAVPACGPIRPDEPYADSRPAGAGPPARGGRCLNPPPVR